MKTIVSKSLLLLCALSLLNCARALADGAPTPAPAPSPAPTPTPPAMSRGEYLFRLAACTQCHTEDAAKPLAGAYPLKTQFGTFYTPNITPDKATGIGNWTESQFVRALRDGVSPDWQYYYPAFPYANYSRLSDADLHELWTYLQAQPAVEQVNLPHDLQAPYDFRPLNFFWRILNFKFECDVKTDADLLLARGPFKPLPAQTPEWNQGAYLVEGVLHCTQCHTPRDELGGFKTNMWMAGSPLFGEKDPASNITPDATTGVGTWTRDDWKNLLLHGKDDQGDPVNATMHQVVKYQTSLLTEADLSAVITYFQSLPAVKNDLSAGH